MPRNLTNIRIQLTADLEQLGAPLIPAAAALDNQLNQITEKPLIMPHTYTEHIHSSVDLSSLGLTATSDGIWIHEDDAVVTVDYYTHHINDTIECDQCHERMHRDSEDQISTDDGLEFCSVSCAENAGYWYNPASGEWTDDPPGGDLQGYYDQSNRMDPASHTHPFLIGIEVEKEDGDARQTVMHSANKLDWVATADSSLCDDTGYELASPAYNLTRNWDEIMGHLDRLSEYIDAEGSPSCGTHITVSDYRLRESETAYNTHNSQLVERLGQFPSLLALLYPTRAQNSYCEESTKRSVLSMADRMAFVNATKDGRVEFRIFPVTKNVEQLKWRIRLIRWALENQGAACGYLRNSLTNPASQLYNILAERLKPARIAELAEKIDAKHRNYDMSPNYLGIDIREASRQWYCYARSQNEITLPSPQPTSPMEAYLRGLNAAGFITTAVGSHMVTTSERPTFINELDRMIWQSQRDAYREEYGINFPGGNHPYRYGEMEEEKCWTGYCTIQHMKYWRLFGYEAPTEVMMPLVTGHNLYLTRRGTGMLLDDRGCTARGRMSFDHITQYDVNTGDIMDALTRRALTNNDDRNRFRRIQQYQLVGIIVDGGRRQITFADTYRRSQPEPRPAPTGWLANTPSFANMPSFVNMPPFVNMLTPDPVEF